MVYNRGGREVRRLFSAIQRKSTLAHLLRLLLIFIFVTIASISFLSYSLVRDAFTKHLTSTEGRMLRVSNEHMGYLLSNVENLSDKIYINRALRDVLVASPEAPGQADQDGAFNINSDYIETFFTDYQLLFRWMKYDVYILGLNGYRRRYSSVMSAETNIYLEDVLGTDWYARVLAGNGQPAIVSGEDSGLRAMEDRVLYARLLKDLDTDAPLGVFILTFSKRAFEYIYTIMLEDDYARLALVDRDGCTVWGDLPAGLAGSLRMEGDSGSQPYSADGSDYQILLERVPKTDWYAVRSLNLSRLLSFTNPLRWIVIGLCLLCTLLVFLFSAQVVRRVYKPIEALVAAMGSLQLGKSDAAMLDTARDDEIGLLNRGFVSMAARLDASAEQLKEHQEEKRRAEIQALQAQIRPHFLYNALTSIRCVVRQGDGETAQRMIIALVKLLKGSLSSADEFFTLAQEMDILKSYALIYQIRYANFDIDYCVEDSVLDCLVPRMVLQPLVENSIVHGQSDRDGNLAIRIYAYAQGDRLVVDVTDDGQGFSRDACEALLDADGRLVGRPGSVGLRNVAQRIALSFGEQYGLSLVDPEASGTRIRLVIPAIRRGDEAP